MFSETLLEHFQSPRNLGELEGADAEASDENPVCGDRLQVWLRIRHGTVTDMRWRAEGCAPAIAAASVLSEMVRGMSLQEARNIGRGQVAEALGGLPARKAHAASLAVGALHRAVDGYSATGAANPK